MPLALTSLQKPQSLTKGPYGTGGHAPSLATSPSSLESSSARAQNRPPHGSMGAEEDDAVGAPTAKLPEPPTPRRTRVPPSTVAYGEG